MKVSYKIALHPHMYEFVHCLFIFRCCYLLFYSVKAALNARSKSVACKDEVQMKNDIAWCNIIHELCLDIIEENRLPIPTDPDDMYELYKFLRTCIRNDL